MNPYITDILTTERRRILDSRDRLETKVVDLNIHIRQAHDQINTWTERIQAIDAALIHAAEEELGG